MESGLRHEGEDTHTFHHDAFAACIRTADHKCGERFADIQIQGNRFLPAVMCDQQRMTRFAEMEASLLDDPGLDAQHLYRVLRPGLQCVD